MIVEVSTDIGSMHLAVCRRFGDAVKSGEGRWDRPDVVSRISSLPSASTKDIPRMAVSRALTASSKPILSSTCSAGPRTSIAWPPGRRPALRSTTVTAKRYRLSQVASVKPAMLAPEIRIDVICCAAAIFVTIDRLVSPCNAPGHEQRNVGADDIRQ
jgi:hypothetical protein